MNLRLTEHRIRSTCRELMNGEARVSGRAVRRELRDRFGAVGKTARVFQIWRQEVQALGAEPASEGATDRAQLQRRLLAAEAAAAETQARAERAESRERAHQESWAMEIDRLREQLRAQPKYAAQIHALQEQVLKLTAELQAARKLAAD
jgi:hypothetical protein